MQDTIRKIDQFTVAYIKAALWATLDDEGDPLEENYAITDFAPEALNKIIGECLRFQAEAGDIILSDLERAGHDFFLTRNSFGCGFWDGDWEDVLGDRLTALSKSFGEQNLYVGDDGLIYLL